MIATAVRNRLLDATLAESSLMNTLTSEARVRPRADRRLAGAPRTAFVLAGGAALGAMQAGMLHALFERA